MEKMRSQTKTLFVITVFALALSLFAGPSAAARFALIPGRGSTPPGPTFPVQPPGYTLPVQPPVIRLPVEPPFTDAPVQPQDPWLLVTLPRG